MPHPFVMDPAKVEVVPLDSIHRAQRNPRRADVDAIKDSLRQFGQHRPAVVREATRVIAVGNHLHKAAEELGWPELTIYRVDTRRGVACPKYTEILTNSGQIISIKDNSRPTLK